MQAESARWRKASAAVCLLCTLIGGCAPRSFPTGWQGNGRPWFEAQILSGYSATGQQVATLVVSVPHRNLVFFLEGELYVARYSVRAVQKVDGEALRAQEWTGMVSVNDYEQTRSQTVSERRVQLLVQQPKEDEALRVVVSVNVSGTQRHSSMTLEYSPAEIDEGGVSLAETEFYLLRDRDMSSETDSFILEAQHLPDPQHFQRSLSSRFDLATGEPWLWLRLFDLRGTPRETLRLRLRTKDGRQPWSREITLEDTGVESSMLVRIPASALRFGVNELRIELGESSPRTIRLENLGLDLADDRSWKANLLHIDPLADSSEMRRLRSAPAEARETAWSEFWERRDPTPDEPGNERLQEHYRRVDHARRHYRDGTKDGAISDRGRVYIQLGAPASIEDVTSRSDLLTNWQLWRYPNLGVVYYFRMVHGGHYRLAWSEGY